MEGMPDLIVDSDAHVLESEHTWDYLGVNEQEFRPRLANIANDSRQYWLIDGEIAGFRFPALSEQELTQRANQLGRNFVTPAAARFMDDVGLRIQHMDQLGIDVQVLHNTIWTVPVTERPD